MKTIHSIFKNTLFILALFFLSNYARAQEQEASMEKEYDVSNETEISLYCHDNDLVIKTWNNQKVMLTGKIKVSGGSEADRETVIKAFQNPETAQSNALLKINTRFHKNFTKTPLFSHMKLNNGEKVNIKDFSAHYTLWIPESQDLNLKSKYNNIKTEDLRGEVKMEIYNGEIEGGDFGENFYLKLTYTQAQFKNGNNGEIILYDSDLRVRQTGNVNITTRYSELEIEKAGNVKIESYDDNMTIFSLASLEGEAKYSDFELKSNMEKCKLSLYDCELETQNIKVSELDAKYSGIESGILGILNIKKSYDNEYRAKGVVKLHCDESKYDHFVFHSIQESVDFGIAYDTDLRTSSVSEKFKSLTGEFKYCSFDMPLPEALEYKLNFESKYGSVDFPESRFNNNIHSVQKNDNWKFKGSTKENPPCTLHFTSYDSNFDFE